MRKITFSLFLSLGLLSFMANAQYTYDNLGPDPYSSSNFLFTGSGFTTTGFSNIHTYNAGGPGNTWSSVQTLPFAFDFFGTPVTHFIVSKNYLVSFDTSRAGLPVNAGLNDNTALPNAGLPDNTISIFWDNFANGSASLGTNDNVWTGVFGTAPNRQFYVKYYSYMTGGRSFSYGHLVLEEGTNNIYMIDNYMGGTGGSMTIGVQKDTATAVQVAGSPNISPIVTTSSWTNLEYYTFSPRLLSPNEAGISSVDAPSQPFAPGMQTVTATLTNHGTAALTSANIDWSANGVAQTGTTFSGSLAPNATTSINLGMYNFTGATNLSVWSSLPNGVADPFTANDTTMVTLVPSFAGGVYTIDGTQAASATNFINFASAVTAMSGGISGAVTFNVAAGTYNEQVSIGSIIGSSDTNTITFNGASAASTILTHDKSIRNSTLNLDGTSDITIKNMTIAATGGSQSWAIHIWNDANDVIIDSNIITTPVGTTFDVVGIMVSGSETSDNTTADVDDITISNNTVTGGERGISIYGNFTASSRSQNLTIHNNDVQNADDNGFYIVGYNNVTITDNYVDGLTNAFSDGMYSSDLENFTITGNRFKGGDNGIEARDYNFDNTVTSKSLIANNMFIGGDDGLYFDDVEEVDVFHNSCVGADYGVYVNDDANVDFRNNIFMSDGGDIAYYSLDASTTVTLDYNLYYTTGATLAKFGTPTYADLAAFQAGQTALNVNSVSGDPVFLDPTADLHAAGTTANDAGDNTVGITVDYDGDTRPLAPSTTVDIGADEFAPPACAFPGGLASYGVTATTASLTWVENGTATQWEVEWDTTGYTVGSGRFNSFVTNDSTTITSLMAQTTYDWYVRSICTGPTNSPWSAVSSFTTECLPTVAPYTETFDGTTMPTCWTQSATTGGPWLFSSPGFSWNTSGCSTAPTDHTGNSGNYAAFDHSSTDVGVILQMPDVDVAGLTTAYLEFYFFMCGTGYSPINILYVEAWDGTAWTGVDTIQENTGGWKDYGYDISSNTYATNLVRVRFRGESGGAGTDYYGDNAIDDVSIIEAPSCIAPSTLVGSNIGTNSADLGWTEVGTATLWEVEYGALGFALGTGTRDTTSSNPFSISGLTSSTDYEYYVRSICGAADSSAFVGPGSFTTAFQCPAGATCATYTAGDIPTDNAVSYPAPSSCPGSLSLVIPAGDQIDSISTFYDMTAAGGAWMSEQGSYLYSPTTMNFEASGNNGSGTSAGTFSYSRDGLTFANGVTGTVAIEMHAERSWGGSGCGTAQNKVDNGTWTVIAYHSPAPLAPISLPITWDNGATVDLTTIDFGGNTSTLVADPTNASNTVLQSIKGAGAQTWGGTTFGDSLASAIPFSAGNTTIRAVVYSPTSGIEVRLKVEDKTNPAISVETGVQTMVVNGWDTLSFNFTNNAAGTGAINFANTYDKMSIFYNFGVSPTAAETYYVDYVEDVSANAAPPVPAKAAIALPITWDDTANVDYSVIDFGGNNSMSVADPTNATNIVLQSIKGAGAQTWGGTTFGDSLASAIPFSAGNTTIRAVVYSPTAGTPVRLKVEDYNNPAISVETEVLTTVANGWDTLNFDMSVQAPMTAAINFANTYNKMSIFYNFGTSPTAAETYYVDYVEFGNPPNVIGIPYTQNFDAFPAGNISSEGWTNSRGSSVPDWTAGGSTGSSGTGPLQDHTTGTGLFVYTETSGTTAGVVDTLSSPAVTFGATNTSIELKYYYHMHGSTMGDLQVWVDTNGVWDSLTTYVGQQQANQADPWMKGSHILNGYEGQQVTVHFLGVSGASFSSDMAVDDVTLDIPPSCIEPSSLVTTSIGADSAVLGWTENNAATTWEVEWGPVGFTPGTGTVVSANANPFTLSGLSTLTEYSWRVRSLCSPTDSSLWSVMSSFKTAFQCPAGAMCNTYTAGDISTDDAVSYPAQSACPGSMDLIIPTGNRIDSVRSFYDMTAQNGAWMSEQESYLYSPTTMNIEPGASAGAGNGAGTMNYDRSGLTFANGGVDTVVVELHAIRTWSSAGNAGCSTFNNKVDSASWTVVAYYSAIPACLEPTGLTGTGTGTTTASVSWTSANTPVAPSYEVSYGPVGFTAGAGTQVTSSTTSTTLTGLTASTTYDFYVRANCGATSTSPWSLVGSFATFNGVPYFQDFEAFTNGSPSSEGWSNFKTSNPQWLVDQGTTPSAGSGTGPTVDHTTGTATGRFVYLETSIPGVAGDADTLYSAVISVGANQNVLELSYWYHMFGATIGSLEAWVEDSSGALTQVGTIVGQQQTVTADPYLRAKHVVNGFANQTIRLVFVGVRGTSFTGDIAIDDVRLDLPPAAEVGITDILRPSSGCGLGADSVEVEITNFGSAAQTGFNIGYSINGVAITPETVSATLGAGMTMNYTFSTTAALGTSGTYDIETYTLLTGDADTSNDTLGVTVNSFASVSAFPYATSFETSNDSWFATGDASWELGAPIGFVIDTAANGTQAWVTDLDAAYGDGLNAFLTSPCFDFSTVANPAINLDIWYDIESQWDGAFLQATTDGGATWNTIGNEGDIINWYNDTSRVAVDNNYSAFGDSWTGDGSISGVNGTNGWIEASHELNGLGGQANVQLRIVFSSDANTNGDGMGVDNIEIYDRDPSYPIALLNTEDASGVADSLNVDAWTSGIVVGIDLDGNNGISFTIIDDESGFQEGMNIFNFNDVSNYVVTEGDEILVHGDIIQFRGLTELSPDSILVLSTGNTIPTPIVVSNLDETTESKWLSIPTSWVSLSTSGSFSSNIDLTNGVDTITMRIDSDTDINDSLTASGMPIVPGDTICGLFGIGGQYASSTSAPFIDGYQIFPMRWSDLTICRLSTGIENVDVETSRFSLVPNPTNGLFEIRSSGFNNPTVNISIRDISGRLISSEIVNNANGNFTKSFDLNEESAGIYFITIVDGESIINEKLILK